MSIAQEESLTHRDIMYINSIKTPIGWDVKVIGPNVSGIGQGATHDEAVAEAVIDYSDKFDDDFDKRMKAEGLCDS